MSPEQAEGRPVDGRSDVFSFGAVLYEMLAGRQAFGSKSRMSVVAAILHEDPLPLSEAEGVPRDLERIIARCLRKNPDRRFHVMIDVKVALEEIKEESESGKLASGSRPAAKKTVRRSILVVGLVVLAGAILPGFWWGMRRQPSAPQFVLTRITFDPGLNTEPTISTDGKLIAYASDRSGRGDLDIWVQQASGGSPVRITSDEADDHEPAFSPDGSTIAFRSEREGGGIYVVPALGGEARLVAKGGRDPSFSPDGTQIAYWTGARVSVSIPSQIHVMPAWGGAAREVQSEFQHARHPIWTPDGRRLLFWGFRPGERPDWWTVPVDTQGRPASTGWSTMTPHGLTESVYPAGWLRERVVYADRSGDSTDLYAIPISPGNCRVTGPPQRITSSLELVRHPSTAAGGRLVFASLLADVNVWGLPVDGDSGKITGELRRITDGAAVKHRPAISRDGKKLLYEVSWSSGRSLVVKDFATAKETTLTTVPAFYPSFNSGGTKVAYSVFGNDQGAHIYVVNSAGGVPEKVCDDCGLTPVAWSGDGSKLLYDWGVPQHLGLFNLVSRKNTELLRLSGRAVTQASFSPDDRWICFLAGVGPELNQVYIMPFRSGASAPPQVEWIAVTDGTAFAGLPRWSPDGNMVYFVSERDGFRCLWAQRLDPRSKQPSEPPLAVYHFHNARRSLTNVGGVGLTGLGVARDKIVFNLGELTGSIWMTGLPQNQK
jgi:Tol biopolymer transport system component